jgi:ABC-type multidrug transport system fused ATPase/permease subunit
MHVRAEFLGAEYSRLTVEANTKLVEAVVNFREVSVKNQRDYYISWMDSRRYQLAGLTAEMTFMPFVSKYVLEIAVIAGAVVMSGIQFLSHDSARAIASISIFFAAGSRIAPAVLRVQQNGIMMKNSQGTAKQTLEMLENLTEIHPVNQKAGIPDFIHKGFIPHIEVFNVSYRYPGKTNNALENICLSIPSGKMVAIVGPSGSGKTTLVDLVLGVLKPDAGSVLVSSNSPTESINIWGGAIGYVPQEVIIFDGTVRQNVTLGLNSELIRDSEVWDALKTANLEQYFRNLPEGLDTQVGERGTQLSGGQRQRLGIARAVFTKPKLLVMDESTSSLDAETESIIIQSLGQLKGETTIILIAHRLATVRPADLVLYMQEGQILQRGTYSELLQSVSDFKNQARLMGLDGK